MLEFFLSLVFKRHQGGAVMRKLTSHHVGEFAVGCGTIAPRLRFFLWAIRFSFSLETNTPKVQFNLESTDTFKRFYKNSPVLCG